MDCEVVAIYHNIFCALHELNCRSKLESVANRHKRVKADYIHTESNSGICNKNTDCSKTDNTESLALDFGTDKLTFALFNHLTDSCTVALESLCPFITLNNLTV